MLNWLDSFWHNLTGTVGQEISRAVHWAEHAIASVILTVFRLVGRAWSGLVTDFQAFHKNLDSWAQSVLNFGSYILHHVIPSLLKWAQAQLARLAADLAQLYNEVKAAVQVLADKITAAAASVTTWVLQHVYGPLKAYADTIWDDLKKWGYTAWWLVTHPADLAELLIDPLTTSLEKHAWQIAAKLGNFALALISANLKRIAVLIEDVITAVF